MGRLFFAERFDPRGDFICLRIESFSDKGEHRHRFYFALSIAYGYRQRARKRIPRLRSNLNTRIFFDEREGGAQDGRARAQVLIEHHAARVRIDLEEIFEGCAGRAAKAEDALIGIADGEDVALLAGKQCHQFDLTAIAILELVYQDEARTSALLRKSFGISTQHFDGSGNHLPVQHPAILLENGFDGGENACDFVAAREDFVAGGLVSFFEFANTRQREVAFAHAVDVGGIVGRSLQLVVAAIEHVEQVAQKLAGITGLAEVMQLQLVDVLAKIYPEIFFLDVLQLLTGALEHAFAVAVNGVGLDIFWGGSSALCNALLQLAGSVAHVSDAEDLFVGRKLVADQACNALDQHRRLACTRSSDHEHGSALVFDRSLLL